MSEWRRRSVAAVALAALLVAAGGAAFTIADETSAEVRRGADLTATAFDCVFAHVVEEVPPGARVIVRSDSTFWLQRLTEIVYPYADVVAPDESATHEIVVVQESPAPDCADIELVVIAR